MHIILSKHPPLPQAEFYLIIRILGIPYLLSGESLMQKMHAVQHLHYKALFTTTFQGRRLEVLILRICISNSSPSSPPRPAPLPAPGTRRREPWPTGYALGCWSWSTPPIPWNPSHGTWVIQALPLPGTRNGASNSAASSTRHSFTSTASRGKMLTTSSIPSLL